LHDGVRFPEEEPLILKQRHFTVWIELEKRQISMLPTQHVYDDKIEL